MKSGVSIIICTYNGRERLEDTLSHLSVQVHSCPAEIIFVDNASTDDSLGFAERWWAEHGSESIPMKTFSQPIPGKSYAQELGYAEASYEYLLVCDDDNWLAPNYVQVAFDVMESDPGIGALGGWCVAAFEAEEPEWFQEQSRYFAVSRQGDESGDITRKKGCLYGAGMVTRKSHWQQLEQLGFKALMSCRKGDKLSSGGDTEHSFALRILGYRIWFDERLRFTHFMTQGRMNLAYLSRLRKAMSESNFLVAPYQDVILGGSEGRGSLARKALRDLKAEGLRRTWDLLFGDYEAKEQSKDFFRLQYFRLFRWKEYIEVRQEIDRWVAHI